MIDIEGLKPIIYVEFYSSFRIFPIKSTTHFFFCSTFSACKVYAIAIHAKLTNVWMRMWHGKCRICCDSKLVLPHGFFIIIFCCLLNPAANDYRIGLSSTINCCSCIMIWCTDNHQLFFRVVIDYYYIIDTEIIIVILSQFADGRCGISLNQWILKRLLCIFKTISFNVHDAMLKVESYRSQFKSKAKFLNLVTSDIIFFDLIQEFFFEMTSKMAIVHALIGKLCRNLGFLFPMWKILIQFFFKIKLIKYIPLGWKKIGAGARNFSERIHQIIVKSESQKKTKRNTVFHS